jgi:hypothetical protein
VSTAVFIDGTSPKHDGGSGRRAGSIEAAS